MGKLWGPILGYECVDGQSDTLVLQGGARSFGNRSQKLNRVYPVAAGKTPSLPLTRTPTLQLLNYRVTRAVVCRLT